MNFLKAILGSLIVSSSLLCSHQTWAQNCPAPDFNTSFSAVNNTNVGDCRQNSSIDVSSIMLKPGIYSYKLLAQNKSTAVLDWQASPVFALLADGTYYVAVRELCDGVTPSAEIVYPHSFVIRTNYTNPEINQVLTPQGSSVCANAGTIDAGIVTGGKAPYLFSLISSVNAPFPDPNPVRAAQSSSVFSGLSAGTYFVRVEDACGSTGQTRQIVLNPVNKVTINSAELAWQGCEKFTLSATFDKLIPNTAVEYWLEFPNGTTSAKSISSPIATSLKVTDTLPLSLLGNVGAGVFPNNLDGSWPKEIKIHLRNSCGEITTLVKQLLKPTTLNPSAVVFTIQNNINCNTVEYQLNLNYLGATTNFGTGVNWQDGEVEYSLNNGVSYQSVPKNKTIAVARNTRNEVLVKYCGQTYTLVVDSRDLKLKVNVSENNRTACYGNSAFQIQNIQNNTSDSLRLVLVSAPSGANVPVDTAFPTYQSIQHSWMQSLPIGDYKFELHTHGQKKCNNDFVNLEFSLTNPFKKPFVSFITECGGDLRVYTTGKFGNNVNLGSGFRVELINATTNTIVPGFEFSKFTLSSVGDTTFRTINGNLLMTLADGNYILRTRFIAINEQAECNVIDIPFVHNKLNTQFDFSGTTNLNNCNGATELSMIVGAAQGGKPPYNWEIRQGNTVVKPWTANHVFTNIPTANNYTLYVNDACGRNASVVLGVAESALPMIMVSDSLVPCEDDVVSFKIDAIPALDISWYKDGVQIPNAISATYTINGIQTADAGVYNATISSSDQLCSIASNEIIVIDPALCQEALPLNLLSFTAHNKSNIAVLNWVTVNETNHKVFIVEKSVDGFTWENIGFVTAQAKSYDFKTNYTFKDEQPAAPKVFYRLKMMATNGEVTFSKVEMLTFDNIVFSWCVQPNLVTALTTYIRNAKGQELKLYNVQGVLIRTIIPDTDYFSIDVSDLKSGVYFLKSVNDVSGAKRFQIIK